MLEVIHSFETSVFTRATWHQIPEDGIFYSHRHESLKSLRTACFCIHVGFMLTNLGGCGYQETRWQYEKNEEEQMYGLRFTPI
jgi:hypothetical protein